MLRRSRDGSRYSTGRSQRDRYLFRLSSHPLSARIQQKYKTELTRPKTCHILKPLPRLGVLDSFTYEPPDLPPCDEDHGAESYFVDDDLVGPAVVDGDWDERAEDCERDC